MDPSPSPELPAIAVKRRPGALRQRLAMVVYLSILAGAVGSTVWQRWADPPAERRADSPLYFPGRMTFCFPGAAMQGRPEAVTDLPLSGGGPYGSLFLEVKTPAPGPSGSAGAVRVSVHPRATSLLDRFLGGWQDLPEARLLPGIRHWYRVTSLAPFRRARVSFTATDSPCVLLQGIALECERPSGLVREARPRLRAVPEPDPRRVVLVSQEEPATLTVPRSCLSRGEPPVSLALTDKDRQVLVCLEHEGLMTARWGHGSDSDDCLFAHPIGLRHAHTGERLDTLRADWITRVAAWDVLSQWYPDRVLAEAFEAGLGMRFTMYGNGRIRVTTCAEGTRPNTPIVLRDLAELRAIARGTGDLETSPVSRGEALGVLGRPPTAAEEFWSKVLSDWSRSPTGAGWKLCGRFLNEEVVPRFAAAVLAPAPPGPDDEFVVDAEPGDAADRGSPWLAVSSVDREAVTVEVPATDGMAASRLRVPRTLLAPHALPVAPGRVVLARVRQRSAHQGRL